MKYQIKIDNSLFLIIKICIAIVLLFSGITKLISPQNVLKVLPQFGMENNSISYAAVNLLAVSEVILGILLFIKQKVRNEIILAILFFLFFFLISIYGYYLGISDDCGCFGEFIKSNFDLKMLVRNFCFMMMSGGLFYLDYKISFRKKNKLTVI